MVPLRSGSGSGSGLGLGSGREAVAIVILKYTVLSVYALLDQIHFAELEILDTLLPQGPEPLV